MAITFSGVVITVVFAISTLMLIGVAYESYRMSYTPLGKLEETLNLMQGRRTTFLTWKLAGLIGSWFASGVYLFG